MGRWPGVANRFIWRLLCMCFSMQQRFWVLTSSVTWDKEENFGSIWERSGHEEVERVVRGRSFVCKLLQWEATILSPGCLGMQGL